MTEFTQYHAAVIEALAGQHGTGNSQELYLRFQRECEALNAYVDQRYLAKHAASAKARNQAPPPPAAQSLVTDEMVEIALPIWRNSKNWGEIKPLRTLLEAVAPLIAANVQAENEKLRAALKMARAYTLAAARKGRGDNPSGDLAKIDAALGVPATHQPDAERARKTKIIRDRQQGMGVFVCPRKDRALSNTEEFCENCDCIK